MKHAWASHKDKNNQIEVMLNLNCSYVRKIIQKIRFVLRIGNSKVEM